MISFSALALSAAVLSAPAAPQQSYNIRVKLAKGQLVRHAVNMKTFVPSPSGKGMNVTIDMLVRQLCKNVNGNKFTIEQAVEKVDIKVPGVDPKMLKNQTDAMKAQKTTTVMDSFGKIVSSTGQSSGFNNPTSYPTGAVKVGQTWSSKVDLPSQFGPMKMQVTNKLVAVEKISGRDCYKIALTMNGTGALSVTGGGTMWIRSADGMPEKGSFTNKMKMSQGAQTISFNVTTSMTRV